MAIRGITGELLTEIKKAPPPYRQAPEVKRASAKRVKLAFAPTKIVLATTQAEWNASSLTEIRSAVKGHPWPTGLRPAVRLVTGLGSGHVEDLRFDLASGATAKWR